MIYDKHVFICTNQKEDPSKKCCGEGRGLELLQAFKTLLAEKNLHISMRAQRTGCFNFCGQGPIVAIYPDGVFYAGVQTTDVAEIVSAHLENNQPVTRLLMKHPKQPI